ncbi:MAG TPA: TRAP transporter large permease subunit, partial [Bryobacterales bacterium]|nr:TRAP transporter large permease subunit [Bryobacterales bacterium]
PIFVPIALQAGIDPIQLGFAFVLNLMIGTITPPVGIVLFVTSKIADISFERLVVAIWPFLLPLLVVLLLILLFPPLTTLLPSLLMG